jgi:hypothetical protein
MSQANKECLEAFNLHRAEEARQALSGEPAVVFDWVMSGSSVMAFWAVSSSMWV